MVDDLFNNLSYIAKNAFNTDSPYYESTPNTYWLLSDILKPYTFGTESFTTLYMTTNHTSYEWTKPGSRYDETLPYLYTDLDSATDENNLKCLKGFKPTHTNFHKCIQAGEYDIIRTDDTLKIGGTTFTKADFQDHDSTIPYHIIVEFCGGGGGGGGGGNTWGSVGGGGGGTVYAHIILNNNNPAKLVLGAGGIGGDGVNNAGGTTGSSGGSSYLINNGKTIYAYGGNYGGGTSATEGNRNSGQGGGYSSIAQVIIGTRGGKGGYGKWSGGSAQNGGNTSRIECHFCENNAKYDGYNLDLYIDSTPAMSGGGQNNNGGGGGACALGNGGAGGTVDGKPDSGKKGGGGGGGGFKWFGGKPGGDGGDGYAWFYY